MKLLVEEINKLIREVFNKQHPLLAEVIINWSKIVGIELSNQTIPLKIISRFERRKKINILYIQVSNDSLSVKVEFQKGIILERLVVYLGYKAIHQIKTAIRNN